MDRRDKCIKFITEKFKDHKAELLDYGRVKILTWKNPKDYNWHIRYVFDGGNMYLAGDIGEAVFRFEFKTEVQSFAKLNEDYFFCKMRTCSNGKFTFDSEEAVKRLTKWKTETIELMQENEVDEDRIEEFEENASDIISEANHCSSINEWEYTININYNIFLDEFEWNYYEWIYDVGTVKPVQNYAFLVGLKMAAKQLEKEELL